MKSIPDTQAGKVVGDMVAVRCAGKGHVILGLRHIHRGSDVIGEATVLIEVDD